jgi:hypothetical protein
MMQDGTAMLNQISGTLDALASQIVNMIGDDRSFMEIWGWNMPAINRHEFATLIKQPIATIQAIEDKQIDDLDISLLNQYPARIQYIQSSTLPNFQGGNAFHVYLTIRSLVDGLQLILNKYATIKLDWEKIKSESLVAKIQKSRLVSLDASISQLTEDRDALSGKIENINNAHAAAEALPTTLSDLETAKAAFSESIETVNSGKKAIEDSRTSIQEIHANIALLSADATKQMSNIDAAYSAATTQGLGRAFAEKAETLSSQTKNLGYALVATLIAGASLSCFQIQFSHELIRQPNVTMDKIWMNALLTFLSVAGPIWLAWLLTKQIGQRFRLAEDYGYKASIAKAYEGYRREASTIDPELAKRLFTLALDRLQEQPLRLVEKDNHGSPFQDMLGSMFSKRHPAPAHQSGSQIQASSAAHDVISPS